MSLSANAVNRRMCHLARAVNATMSPSLLPTCTAANFKAYVLQWPRALAATSPPWARVYLCRAVFRAARLPGKRCHRSTRVGAGYDDSARGTCVGKRRSGTTSLGDRNAQQLTLLGDDHVQAPIRCQLRGVEHVVGREIASSLDGGGVVNTANVRYRTGVALVGIAALLGFATSPPTAEAGPACIRVGGSCFTTLDSALAAAVDGDTVQVPAGTFAGGATITKSITLSGAGQRETTLRGGGPVLTVGAFGDPNPPTVTIRGLTITGGRTTTS